jgi:hypothetical protein
MVSHLIEQTGSAPFSGGAITPKTPTPNPNRRKKAKGKPKPKGQWGSWDNGGAAAHLAGGVFQAQTPLTFLDTDREAEYLATIDRLQARLNISDAQHAFSMQHVYAAQQNGSSASRPRSHYCGLHGWNNDHNGTECRGMASDKRYTPAMRATTTHVGTAAMDGAGTGGGGGKGRLEVRETRADAWENSERSNRAKTRGRDGLSGRGNSLSQGVQVAKGSRERQWEVLGYKLGSKEGMPWIKPFVRALTKVERGGEPKARCQ